jgi:flagellar assembly protein FliH
VKRGHVTLHGMPAESSVADPLRSGGAVLRNVAVNHEPRALRRPAVPPVAHVQTHPAQQGHPHERASRREGDQGDASGRHGEGVTAAAVQQEAASYQEGYRAGYSEAEAAQRTARESALENGYRAGLEQGLQEGREQGLAEGREAGRQVVEREARGAQEATAARLAQLDQLLSALPAEISHRLASAEEDMVALCHAIVCRILGDQLLTREGVAHCVRQAVREACPGSGLSAPGPGFVAIHVHPRDLESMQGDGQLAAWLRQGATSSSASAVHWVADERVQLGGCLVRSTEGSLDARLETQMAALRDLLSQAQSADASGGATSVEVNAASTAAGRPSVGA